MAPAAVDAAANGVADFRHLALVYDDAPGFVTETGRFVVAALEAREPVLVAVPHEHLTALRAHVADRVGLDLASSAQWFDMAVEGRNPGRILPRVLDAFVTAHPGERLLMVGEPIWPERESAEYAAAVRHEALINLSFVGEPVTVLCPYDRSRLPGSALFDMETTHPEVVSPEGTSTDHAYGDPATTAADALEPFDEPPAGTAVVVVLDGSDLGPMRQVVAALAREAGLDGDRTTDLSLAAHELCMNSLVHAGGPALLRVWALDDEVVCEAHDRGSLGDPLVGRRAVRPGQTDGLGLLLVNELCDLVEVEDVGEGVTTRLHIRLPRPADGG